MNGCQNAAGGESKWTKEEDDGRTVGVAENICFVYKFVRRHN